MAEPRKLRGFNWGPFGDPGGWTRGVAVSIAAGAFLSLAGAFGMDGPLIIRLAYWIPLLVAGTFWGVLVSGLVFGDPPSGAHLSLRVLATALLIAAPFTGVVWLTNTLFMGSHIGPAQVPVLFLSVTAVSVVMTAINVLVARGQTVAAELPPAPARFLERLPPKLLGAEIWAVESEDHYLRLHTSKGQDLILLRLADAVAELEGIEGAQVHRSWWVARDAIQEARRGDGRATLTLKDGSEVPVSRTYAKVLRDRNWI